MKFKREGIALSLVYVYLPLNYETSQLLTLDKIYNFVIYGENDADNFTTTKTFK